jgi:hypothetical protein
MSPFVRNGPSDSTPIISVGILILAAGLALLLAGDAFLPSDPAERSLWSALVGILLILAGLAYAALPPAAPVPSPSPPSSRPRPSVAARTVPPAPSVEPSFEAPSIVVEEPVAAPAPAPAPAPVPIMVPVPVLSAAPSVQRAAAMAAESPDLGSGAARSSGPTSIPAAYLQALSSDRTSADAWAEVAPPIAAALPFSPGIRRSTDPSPPWDESSDGSEREAPRLELELARLRARVRELEIPTRASAASSLTFPRLTVPTSSAKEPPTPPSAVAAGPKGCVACGSGLKAVGPAHLCWGCGRSLCSTCYWRFGPGPGLHRCPDCMSRAPAGSESISGGRVTASSDSPAAAMTAGPRAPRY